MTRKHGCVESRCSNHEIKEYTSAGVSHPSFCYNEHGVCLLSALSMQGFVGYVSKMCSTRCSFGICQLSPKWFDSLKIPFDICVAGMHE
jgi:hypothetical protein